MYIKHLGGGVLYIENILKGEPEGYLASLDFLSRTVPPHGYTPSANDSEEPNGVLVNKGGYEIGDNQIPTRPSVYNVNTKNQWPFSEFGKCSYVGLLEYCKIFPAAIPCVTNRTPGHLLRYSPGHSIGPHSDAALPYQGNSLEPASLAPIKNTLTSVLFLNDRYEGGDVVFRMWGITIKPEYGSMLIYPSSFIGCHEVSPVMAGDRWVFIRWFTQGDSIAIPNEDGTNDQREWVDGFRKDVGTELSQCHQLQENVSVN